MDIGLVCDDCDAFNPMTSQACGMCGASLSLGTDRSGGLRTHTPEVKEHAPASKSIPPTPTPRPSKVAAASDFKGDQHQTNPAGSGIACPRCRETIQPGFRFCGKCGAPVGAAPPAPEVRTTGEQIPAKPPSKPERRTMFFGQMQQMRAKLVLIKGDGLDGISFTLAGKDHLAGRIEGPLLFRDDPFLSPRHANFYYKDNRLYVSDMESANGVYIRIRGPHPIKSGSSFLIGEQVLRVETTAPETAGLGPDKTGTYFYASPRRQSRLRLVQILRGGETGLVFRATGDNVSLGREDNDINFPDDPFISGRHARVSIGDGGLMLTDLGSKNGTFLRIDEDKALSHGDYLFMGQQLLRVEIV